MCSLNGPYEHGVAVYTSEDKLIIWNHSHTFNTYYRKECDLTEQEGGGCAGEWEIGECNTSFAVKSFEQAKGFALELAKSVA